MSKLGPLGQSMAALFSPDRASKAKASDAKSTAAPTAKSSFQVPGTAAADKSADSLGNGSTPGYEFFGKKPPGEDEKKEEKKESPLAHSIEAPAQGTNVIRLSLGWEKLLVAQKKICEKAKGIFTRMEGGESYAEQKRGRMKFRTSSGCILDLDSKEIADAKAAEAEELRKKFIA
ncbi:MAG: hypothetical protein ACXVBE_01255 [Bdellovibrionota bacterium]